MSFLTGIWSKVAAACAAVAGVLMLIVKYQSGKIDRLENENETLNKKNEIKTQAAVDKARVVESEQDEILKIEKESENYDKKVSIDDLNSL